MEDLYSIHPGFARGWDSTTSDIPAADAAGDPSDLTDLMKAQIASHPRYPSLVSAYIECRKVGAPPEMAAMMEEIIGREKSCWGGQRRQQEAGSDPELDEFMDSYCAALERCKEELSRQFDEAAEFLTGIENQLRNLCSRGGGCATAATTSNNSDEAAGSSAEELSCGGLETSEDQHSGPRAADRELKEMLLKKYSSYLSSLRKEFLKKRKIGKLPKDARSTLLDWWNSHYRWPYPAEEEKAELAEVTGLDQKQISNWFINQRKRHWRPSEDIRFALLDGVGGGSSGTTLCFDTGMIGPGG